VYVGFALLVTVQVGQNIVPMLPCGKVLYLFDNLDWESNGRLW